MSHGVRVYHHFLRHKPAMPPQEVWARERECHNYYTGIPAVKRVVQDLSTRIVAVGTESGAMCVHYRENYSR